MALFRIEAKIISRSQGKSACSAAAYRAGQKIVSKYDGETYDYRRKQNVEDAVVILPDNAPAEYYDREALWSTVEINEKQSNAQLAREILLALPKELPFDARQQMTVEYVQEQFVDDGMCADISWHNPPRMNSKKQPVDLDGNVTYDPSKFIYDNPHAHILLTLRPLSESGEWEAKKQKLYVCVKDGEERLMPPSDLKVSEGWEKIYHYTDQDGKKAWLTKSYVAEHPEYEYKLINKYPKSVQDVNPKIARWNNPETLVEWRAAWAEKINMTLKMYGIDEEVSHLSYKEQGLDLIPTVHEGKEITIEEKRLKEEYDRKVAAGEEAIQQHTEIRYLNLAIKEHNEELKIIYHIQKLKQQMEEFLQPIQDRIKLVGESIVERLEHLRCEIISIGIKIKDALTLKETVSEKIKYNREYIDTLHPMREERLKQLQATLVRYQEEYTKMHPLYKHKREALQEKISLMEHELSIQKENAKYAVDASREIKSLTVKAESLNSEINKLVSMKENKIAEYETLRSTVPEHAAFRIEEERLRIRPNIEAEYDEGKKHKFKRETELFDRSYNLLQTQMEQVSLFPVIHI